MVTDLMKQIIRQLQVYAGVPASEVQALAQGLDELAPFATEVELLASDLPDGVSAYAHDTDEFFFRCNGSWETSPNSAIAVGAANLIQDADNDTRVETEASADEDVIRMFAQGTELMTIEGPAKTFSLGGGALVGDVVAGISTIGGTNAWASAATNQDGGDILIRGGANATGGGSDGDVYVGFETDLTTQRGNVLFPGSVGIGGAADSNAVLALTSTSKGLLPPRMTAAQRNAISSPPAGLMLYDATNNKLDFFDSSVWKALVSTDVSTFTVGSIPFATGAHHISDDYDNFCWDNTAKRLGVGTNTPSESLQVVGNARVERIILNRPGESQSAYIQKGAAGVAKGMSFYTVDNHRMIIAASGQVGIGTDSPDTPLHIYGAGDRSIKIESSDDNQATLNLTSNGIQKGLLGYNEVDNLVVITHREAGTDKLNADLVVKDGIVGIGTDTPVEPLTVDVKSDTHGGIEITNSSSGTGAQAGIVLRTVHDVVNRLGIGTTYGWQLVARSDTWAPSSEQQDLMLEYRDGVAWRYVMFFEHDTGNVGIGTETPGEILDVDGNIAVSGTVDGVDVAALDASVGLNTTHRTTVTGNPHVVTQTEVGLGNVDNTSDSNKPVSTATQTALDLKAPLASPVFTGDIETPGNIGAGKSIPDFRFDAYINRTGGIVRSARFVTDGNHVDARGLYVVAGEDTETGTNYWFEARDGNDGLTTGGLRSVAGVFDVYNASDRRLKQNIKDTKMSGKEVIGSLRVRDFEWKSNPEHEVTGFIAQEVLEIYPNAVGEPDPETGMYGMSNAALIPPLVGAVQEQQLQIDEMKETIAAQQRQIDEM